MLDANADDGVIIVDFTHKRIDMNYTKINYNNFH